MFAHSGDANLSSSGQSVFALFSPMIAEAGVTPTVSRAPTLDVLSATEQGFYPTQDIVYNCDRETVTLQGTNHLSGQSRAPGSPFNTLKSFREIHSLLDGVYNSFLPFLEPCAIGGKDLEHVARRVGIPMEEVLCWFEDEKLRRTKNLSFQFFQPQQLAQQSPISPAATTTSGLNRTVAWSTSELGSLLPGTQMQLDENFPLLSPPTPLDDHMPSQRTAKRGRPQKTKSLTPSVSPSPKTKRQKLSAKYPCTDCSNQFSVDRWPEHYKRSHFPDHIWECQNMNGRTGRPCKEKAFYRQDNFVTHLKGEHGCTKEVVSRLKTACKFPVVGFFHEKCGFMGCYDTFKNRDESMEHIKEHFRQFSQSSKPPEDLGASQWTLNCASKHTLKRGIHYLVTQGVDQNNSQEDEDQDDNNDDGSHNPNSSNQSQNLQSSPDNGLSPGKENNSPDSAGFESSQDSSNMEQNEYSANAPQTNSVSEINHQNSEYNFGLENFVLPFTIRRRLGSGGQGLVDEVFSVSFIETFARKCVLRKDGACETSAQMLHLKNEPSTPKQLSHPHLMKLIGAYADAKYSYIITSPVAEQNLANYLHSPKSSELLHLLQWMGCLSSAINYLHSQRIQHLNIKPQNILLKGENVLLTDFGTAKCLSSWPLNRGALAVTPMYCAPETMLHGQQEFSSDIFSLGCVFSEMMTRNSGRSILEFEEFRLKSGKKVFHSTVSEVMAWMTLLPCKITSNRTPDHLTKRETQFREMIIQMLAKVSSDRPKASELQSCFLDMNCQPCKLYSAGLLDAPSAVIPEYESSFTSRSIPSSGNKLNSTEHITTAPKIAINISKITKIGHIDKSPPPNFTNPTSPASSLSQVLENINLLAQVEIPGRQSSKSKNLSSKNASLEDAEKVNCTYREHRKVFSDMEVDAHMLTYRDERLQECPTCDANSVDGLDYHDHLDKCALRDMRECYEESPVNSQPAEEAKTKVTLFQPSLDVIHRNNTQILTIDGADMFSTVSFPEDHVRCIESSNGQSMEYSGSVGDTIFTDFTFVDSIVRDSRIHGTQFAIDREVVEDSRMSDMPYDSKREFEGLYSREPRTVYDSYELVPHQQSPFVHSESMSDHCILPSQSVSSQITFKDVWTPNDSTLPACSQGFVAFAPDSESDFYAKRPTVEQSESSQLQKPRAYEQPPSSAKGIQYVFVDDVGPKFNSEYKRAEPRKRLGVRKGVLDSSCDAKEICHRCDKITSPLDRQLCWRYGFKDFESLFFPEFMYAHLRKSKIEDLISEHTTGFLDITINVEVLTGSFFKPMKVKTNYFEPQTLKLLRQPILTPAEGDQASQFVQYACVPVGILEVCLSEIRNTCKNHIEDMVSDYNYASQTTAGDKSKLPNQILEIACEYSAAKKESPILRNALKLHAIHHFMSSYIIFSDKTADEVLSIHPLRSPPPRYLGSRLLNRQLKYVMHKVQQELTLLVLEDLERSLRSRTKDSWGASFCTILILCLCIEKLQNAADAIVSCEILENGESAAFTRNQIYNACSQLEEYPFNQFKKLIHEIYKSHKFSAVDKGRRDEKGFNPLKMAAGGVKMDLDLCTEGMVKSIYEVVNASWSEITELSERPKMNNLGPTDIEPGNFMANNTGRLAAIFLKSFFDGWKDSYKEL